MIYNTYGSTGIKVSAIGFGGMRFEGGADECASLVKAAYESGINYFDTAPKYGNSEDIFGAAFKEMKKTRASRPFYVSTKSSSLTPAEIRRDFETSLKRMGLDYIDFYHVWCLVTLDEFRSRKAKGVLKEFEKLKSEGLVKNICVSSHMTGSEIAQMLADYPFAGILLGYSVSNFAYREEGLEAAAKLNRGLVIMNPLAGGAIPQNPERFSFVRTRPDETAVEGALRFLLNDKRITVALVGMSNKAHLAEAISAVNGLKPISESDKTRIRGSLNKAFDELCTACSYCDSCPQGIPIPEFMDSYNQYALLGKSVEMINRIRWHWNIALEDEYLTKCNECHHCEGLCTQKLPICERLKFIRDEVQKFLKSESQKTA